MRNESRGFALLTVLWLITALSALVGLSLTATRLGQRTTLNRVLLARGRWAAEACLAITHKRWTEGQIEHGDTIDLGRGTRCTWRVADPTARINVNTADAEVLRRVLPDSLVEAILQRRLAQPFESVAELAALPGFTPEASALLTVDGPGSVNLNAAPPAVLAALPGITAEAVGMGRPMRSLDELAGELSVPARATLLERYADLARIAVFAPPQLVVTAQGWVGEWGVGAGALRSTIELVVVPLPDRLATIRRRMW